MRKSVLIIGTGTIGEPLIGLLSDFKEELEVENVFFYKRTPLLDEVAKVNCMIDSGAKLVVTDKKNKKSFTDLGNEVSGYFKDALKEVDVIVDCTPAGNQNKELYYLPLLAEKAAKGETPPLFVAQGSEKGFGVPYAHGINDSVLENLNTDFVQVVSCNTHNIARLIAAVSSIGKIMQGDFVCMRRSNDVSQDIGYVPSTTVSNHSDPKCGTHHSRDVHDLLKTVGKSTIVYSSALKINTQYMHSIRFSLQLKNRVTTTQVIESFEEDKLIATTYKNSANKIFSFGRDHGYYGRIFNQTVIPIESVATFRKPRSGTLITGFCFTPQDGNSLLSSTAAVARVTLGKDYLKRLDFMNELLFDFI